MTQALSVMSATGPQSGAGNPATTGPKRAVPLPGSTPEIAPRQFAKLCAPRLAPETVEQFILDQLDRAGLGHNTFSPEALALIVRSGEGLLRRTRNLCLSALIEAVRDQTRMQQITGITSSE